MEKTYIIAWKSKSRGSVGRGKTIFTREEACQIAQELNEEYPDFFHEPLNLDTSPALPIEPEIPETALTPEPSPIVAFPVEEEEQEEEEVFA